MATGTLRPPAPSRWESFALTDTRWLRHAFGWTIALWLAMAYFRWLFYLPMAFLEFGVAAGFLSAFAMREVPALPASTVVRYALVDTTFVVFAAPWAIIPLELALKAADALPLIHYGIYPVIPIGLFAATFYLTLGATGNLLANPKARSVPAAAAAACVLLLAAQAWFPATEHYQDQGERDSTLSRYEQSTGRKAGKLDMLAIGNSRHGFDNRAVMMQLDPKGRVLVAGGFSFYGGRDARGFVRILPDGSLDPTFAPIPPGDPVLVGPRWFRVLPDGTIYVFSIPGVFSRHDADGRIDASYRPEVRVAPEAFDVASDGSVVSARGSSFNGLPGEHCIARLDPSGRLDPVFGPAAMEALFGPVSARPYPTMCQVSSIAAIDAGRWLVTGNFASNGFQGTGTARLNPDGTLDATYGKSGNAGASVSHLSPDGATITVDYPRSKTTGEYVARLTRVLPGGEIDPVFKVPDGTLFRVEAIAPLSDGRVIVSGSQKAMESGRILRLTPDGRIDPTFGGADGVPRIDGFATVIKVQPDGAILVAGEFIGVRHGSKRLDRSNIARFTAEGVPDPTFDPR